ncbi:MAG: M20/M25/M40 family metallo-hydrolase [Desulfobacterales bacterium]|nr:M20/M25/M40 family metallo-hydrolase [Desulfobacterales bacterium]
MDEHLFEKISNQVDTGFLSQSLMEMVSIKSENPFDEAPRPGYREKEMAEYLADTMTGLGMAVSKRDVAPGRPNVFGTLKGTGSGPVLMLAGHTDTARTDGYKDAYDVREDRGKIYGRGACDMKAGIAAYLEVARLLKASGTRLSGDLIIAGIADEEFRMLGSKDVGRNGPFASQGIIGEPTELAVCPANKGRVSTFIRTHGRAAHSSVPEQGTNAILHMAEVIRAFQDYNQELLAATPHPLCGHGRFNPGIVKGGVQVNMVPDLCELEVDRRTLPGETKDGVYEEFRRRLDPLGEKIPGFRYDLTDPSWLIPPNDIAVDEPVVQSLLTAHAAVTGQTVRPTAFVAGSDAPHMGFPTVVCGPGSINQAHSTREFVSLEQVADAARMYLRVVLDLVKPLTVS